jgi:tetratricopeptide (TPR) repeat protein
MDEDRLRQMLRDLPDREAPPDLADRIMAEIGRPRKKTGSFFSRLLASSFTIRVRPFRIAAALCTLAVFFWLGFTTGSRGPDFHYQDDAALNAALENARANHLVGRGLLEDGRARQALPYLRRASLLAPRNSEYALWEGVAVGRQSDRERERAIYRQIIDRSPGYVPARLYLGHNLLEEGRLEEALAEYNRVLAMSPGEETALYNRALVYRLMQSPDLEAAAWKEYLFVNRQGKWAYRAAGHLNSLGDFTYRSYQVGFRRIILNQDLLLGDDTDGQLREAELLAAEFLRSSGSTLHVIVFSAGHSGQAEETALHLRSILAERMPSRTGKNIEASWFGKPESVKLPSGRQHLLPEGLLIFSQPRMQQPEEKAI